MSQDKILNSQFPQPADAPLIAAKSVFEEAGPPLYADAVAVLVAVPVLGVLLLRGYASRLVGRRAAASVSVVGGAVVPGFALVALFFVGQPGFTVYAAYIATTNGLAIVDLPLIYAVGKGAAACVLLATARKTTHTEPTLLLSAVLAAAVIGMLSARSGIAFLAALLAWELAVNLQSTRYQAEILRRFPAHGGRWLMATIACGAAAGPVIHDALLKEGLGLAFALLSVATAFIPVCWLSARRCTEHGS